MAHSFSLSMPLDSPKVAGVGSEARCWNRSEWAALVVAERHFGIKALGSGLALTHGYDAALDCKA